jgi:hypothetical protein|tara:strand:- start:381 stop:1160 length:780 start_codon:yes stop_codon:yes gene_type:complete
MGYLDIDTLKQSLVRRDSGAKSEPPTLVPSEHAHSMAAAADDIEECYRVLKRGGTNLVAEVLRGYGTFTEWHHYPPGDIHDPETSSQYYYHAHRPGEHGHFHTFLRKKGMPRGCRPAPLPASVERPIGKDAISHIIAISMDKSGYPIRLFTANRWLVNDTWYKPEYVTEMIDLFDIDHAWPCWATNRWVGAMLRLFRPQIEWLVAERDEAVRVWQAGHPDSVVYEDRDLDITSMLDISVEDQIRRVRAFSGRELSREGV